MYIYILTEQKQIIKIVLLTDAKSCKKKWLEKDGERAEQKREERKR